MLAPVRQEANAGAPGRPGKGGGVIFGGYPVERRPMHGEQRGDHWRGLALGAKGTCMGDLRRRQLRLGAEFDPTAPSSLDFGVESFQFHAGVFDTKLPIDAALFAVRLVRPGCNFSLQYGQFTDAAVAETLAR
jgi:hypothetical protein